MKIIIGIIIAIILFWLWLHWGRRGTRVAMLASYYAIERAWKRQNPNIDQKTILIKTLQSRLTYKNRPLEELEKIVFQHSTIEDLIEFVIENELLMNAKRKFDKDLARFLKKHKTK